jgi:hypothetical protein
VTRLKSLYLLSPMFIVLYSLSTTKVDLAR